MVALRLDRRLQGRIDPSDVIQEAFLEVRAKRIAVQPAWCPSDRFAKRPEST